jgi:hypothetical protein
MRSQHEEDASMTDPLNPSHQEPAEGPRDADFSAAPGAETTKDAGGAAGDATANASARANEVIDQIRDVVEDLAERAAPTVREISAKAAEIVAVAADKAVPVVQRAGEVTAEASGKLAEKSRTLASDLREGAITPSERVKGTASEPADPATDAARDAAEGNPPL